MFDEHACMKLVLVLVMVAAAGCTKANPASCLDDHCSDPARPFCDADGTIGGEPNTCIAVTCSPGEFAACRDDRALTCNSDGNNFDLVECEFGCSEAAGGCNACNTTECEEHIIPRYLPTVCDALAAVDALTISSEAVLDTSNELNCHSVIPQVGGPDLCVLHYKNITIERNQTLLVSGTRAIALVADYSVVVDGVLDISGGYGRVGPGYDPSAPQPSSVVVPNGAGAVGQKTVGGSGGNATADGGAMNGGSVAVHPASVSALVAGPRKSYTGTGAGGGAATLIACRGSVVISGMVDAGGAGGLGGYTDTLSNINNPVDMPAGGGGPGGTVVLQGMSVSVTGELYANGGGGGGARKLSSVVLPPPDSDPARGSDGTRSTSPAPGGLGDSGGGNGGAGGSRTSTPGHGKAPATADHYGGGGGGSVGFFLSYTPAGVSPTITPSASSPAFEANGTVATSR